MNRNIHQSQMPERFGKNEQHHIKR